MDFDYIIIGAGSAGCVLANRLTENPGINVLLLEAGGWDRDPWIHIPLGWGRILQRRLHDWMYFGEPEPNVDNRQVECARGKVIGGSSSINAMAYVRGHRADYDRWAQAGLTQWSYAHVLPYFRKQESWESGATLYRGADGPLHTRKSRYQDPLVQSWIAAGKTAGFPWVDDYNAAGQEGFSLLQSTIRNGKRCSNATAYLHPALRRANLTVRTHALTHKILLQNKRAMGVAYSVRNKLHQANARREVLLCAGVINSPQILMLSGMGNPAVLQSLGIPIQAALPGVGQNLQDHLSVMIAWQRKTPGPFQKNMRLDRVLWLLAKAWLTGRGFATDLPSGVTAFLKSKASEPIPDVQLLFHAGPLMAGPWLPPFRQAFADGFSCRAVLLRPESRGHVALASSDPLKPVRIHQNFLDSSNDWHAMRQAFQLLRTIAHQPVLQPYIRNEILPGNNTVSEAEIDEHIRKTAITVHHPVGTCRMGTGKTMDVIDQNLRVFGVQGLRVVDGSSLPDLVGGNVNAAITMMAEKAADLILNRPPLPPTTLPPDLDAVQTTTRGETSCLM